jgi:hypothetical protein
MDQPSSQQNVLGPLSNMPGTRGQVASKWEAVGCSCSYRLQRQQQTPGEIIFHSLQFAVPTYNNQDFRQVAKLFQK